ncbi:toll/interleukin-1 receptor domain-containing protein [Streptomyces niveiscabiei]|uniref:toll/interleukin-1 receptor domain-containing protein n=1 Tax=Streptomyces niveiscabiei TaxID=164115 RepID=UPI0029B155C3|nr:toll/interleukin-1 receptor domain-containing protein [Streptomyces niveiscabiei]MDX3385055.1 toll/interleukin-1 receptor domain-containing protein [Streptomyces niveiscabiei]
MDRSVNYFYTSCTRGDGWPSLSRFHADLEYRLKAQEGLWVAGVLGPQTGSGPVLQSGVAQVGVMVALYSPEYFRDGDCGLEWAVFRRRIRGQEYLTHEPLADCLIPLVWKPVPPRERPGDTPDPWPFLAELRGADSEAGRLYERRGLSGLMQSQLPEAGDLYVALLGLLARRIAMVRHFGLGPLEGDELRTVAPAFGTTLAPASAAHVRRTVPGGDLVAHGSAGGGYLSYSDVGHRGGGPPGGPAAELRSVAISYVGADQPWADWMQEVLEEDTGSVVHQVRWRTELEPLSEAVARAREEGSRIVVVFSRSYFTAGAPDPYQWEEVFLGEDAADLIPVQIDAEPRPLLVRRGVPVVQLTGSDEGQAQLLRDMVHDAGPTVPGQREGDAR